MVPVFFGVWSRGSAPNDKTENGDPAVKILAMDLGKSKAVGCVYDIETHKHRFDSVPLGRRTLILS